jgi:hypothetical protein
MVPPHSLSHLSWGYELLFDGPSVICSWLAFLRCVCPLSLPPPPNQAKDGPGIFGGVHFPMCSSSSCLLSASSTDGGSFRSTGEASNRGFPLSPL